MNRLTTPTSAQLRTAQPESTEGKSVPQAGALKQKQTLLSIISATSKVRDAADLVTLFSKKINGSGKLYKSVQIVLFEDKSRNYLSAITQEVASLLENHPEVHLKSICLLAIDKELCQKLMATGYPLKVNAAVNQEVELRQLLAGQRGASEGEAADNCLLMPLIDHGTLIGLLQINAPHKKGFPLRFQNLIYEIAPLLTGAVLNVIDRKAIIQKSWEERFLLAFSSGIAAVRTKEELSAVVYSSLKQLSMVRAYFIRVLDESKQGLIPFIHDKDAFYTLAPSFKTLLGRPIDAKQGISGRVLKAKKPVVIDFNQELESNDQDPYVAFWNTVAREKKGFEKMTGAALRVANQNIGILWVITDRIDTRLLEGVCAQISIAISNIRANEELLHKQQQKDTLLQLSQEMAALRDRNGLFQQFYTKVTAVLGIEEFGMLLLDEGQGTYSILIDQDATFARLHPGQEAILTEQFQASDPVFSRITQADAPVYFDVAALSAVAGVPGYVNFWRELGLRRVAGVALRAGGVLIGIAIFHVDPVVTTPEYSALLQSVTHQLAVAISNIQANEKILQFKRMLELENGQLKDQINQLYNFSQIIGNGSKMQEVYRLIRLVASTNSTVLILGETGTGKELIARAIHHASPRKDKLMIQVNCAALPANLIESELFGHERGAFTGAVERRVGKFELASGSTLFLDEVGEMPLETQVKLLRVIQEREFERIGGHKTIKVDVRIIAATNRKLDIEVNEGRFRPDLYYRLNVFPIHLPALRDRLEDVEELTRYFVQKYSKRTGHKINAIAASVFKELRSYPWPGNVRELEHLIERSILLMEGAILRQVQLPAVADPKSGWVPAVSHEKTSLRDMEAAYIIAILKSCMGKISGVDGAASRLSMPATTLHSKIKKLGIKKSDYLQ